LHPEITEIRDRLTGTLTRRDFLRIAKKMLKRLERNSEIVSLAFLDVDGLKAVNDTQGHRAGDRFIQKFGKAILENLRPLDICSRWYGENGDEFVLIFPGVGFDDTKKVICRIEKTFPCFSWGVIEFVATDNLEPMIQRAEESMYRNKRSKASDRT